MEDNDRAHLEFAKKLGTKLSDLKRYNIAAWNN